MYIHITIQEILLCSLVIIEYFFWVRLARLAEDPAESFFAEVAELDVDFIEQEVIPLVPSTNKDTPQSSLDEGALNLLSDLGDKFNHDDNDFLSIEDLEHKEFEYDNPSTRIDDNIQGLQQWVVTVIGKEGNHIHVCNGGRVWIKVNHNMAKTVAINDVLLIKIKRTGDDIKVKSLVTIETDVSDEYIIPDEAYLYEQSRAVAY